MTNPLREPLSGEQAHLIRVIYEPFDQSEDWPIWQYVDLTLDGRLGLDAADVLASLPRVGTPGLGSHGYELTWYQNSSLDPRLDTGQPDPGTQIALTVAGLRYLPEAKPLLTAFLATIRHAVDQQRRLVPSPSRVVEAGVGAVDIEAQVLAADIRSDELIGVTMRRLQSVVRNEPFLHSEVSSRPGTPDWGIRVPAVLRAYRGVTTIDDYLDRVIELVAPSGPPSVPLSSGALDIPYAVGYLDAVWQSRTGSRLFVNLDPASVARLTQPCGSEQAFNSLMSALADVLGLVVPPGRAMPPQGGALEAVRDYLTSQLEPEAADRVDGTIGTLIRLRKIRVSTQHSDARHRAVAVFQEIGLPFPPASWEQAWTHIAALTKGALDVLREEVHTGLPQL